MQILVFGDSITDGAYDSRGGWADRLKQFLMAENIKTDVVNNESNWLYNLGISGNLTVDILERIEVEAIARKVNRADKENIFVFAIGLNDSCSKGTTDPKTRSTEDQFTKNYLELINFAKQYSDKIICIGLTPVDENKTNPIYNQYWYKNERINKFDKLIKQTAANNNVNFVEIFDPFSIQLDAEELLIDGIHPNDKGHEWMYNQILPKIKEFIP